MCKTRLANAPRGRELGKQKRYRNYFRDRQRKPDFTRREIGLKCNRWYRVVDEFRVRVGKVRREQALGG